MNAVEFLAVYIGMFVAGLLFTVVVEEARNMGTTTMAVVGYGILALAAVPMILGDLALPGFTAEAILLVGITISVTIRFLARRMAHARTKQTAS